MEEVRRLTDVIVDDQDLVSQIISAFYQKLGETKHDDIDFKEEIDKSVEQVFLECEIYETLSRAVERFRAAPRLDVCATTSPNSLKKPCFSSAEPTKSSQLSRSSPNGSSSEQSPLRGKGQILKGKYSPLASSATAAEQSHTIPVSADEPGKQEIQIVKNSFRDGFSPPPDVQQTESPDIVEGGYGVGEKKLINISAAAETVPGSSSPKKNVTPRSGTKSKSAMQANGSTGKLSPSSSPGKDKKRYPFGSPGSVLEDDENFEDSFDGGDVNAGVGDLQFTKRYRFLDGMPTEEEKNGEMQGGLTGEALAAAVGGHEEAETGKVTDDWLLSQSEGNPDESSLGDSFASSLNNSFSSVRSSHSIGSRRRGSPGSPGTQGTPSPARRMRRHESVSRSPSLGKGSIASPVKSPKSAEKSERVFQNVIDGLGKSTSPAGRSLRAVSRYGEADLRDSLESDPVKTSSPMSLFGADNATNMEQTYPSMATRSAGDVAPKAGRRSAKSSPASSISGSAQTSPISPKISNEALSPVRVASLNSKDEIMSNGVVQATSFMEESSIESGGPGGLDGGEEVYICQSTDESNVQQVEIDDVKMSLSLGKTIRTPGGLQAALRGADGMEEDFIDDFEEMDAEDEYDEENFASDQEDEDVDALAPRASPSSPTRSAKKGKPKYDKEIVSSADDACRGSDIEKRSADCDEDREQEDYSSDDFEIMDYEKDDKPNRKRVRFPRKTVVTDVHMVREKYGAEEKDELFYSHDETTRFTLDYSKETMKAEMMGLSWNDWWNTREEADVIRDEEEEDARRASGEDWYGNYYDYEDEEGWEEEALEIEEVDDDAPSVELEDSNEFSNF